MKKYIHASADDYYDLDDWYYSDEGEAACIDFAEKLEQLVMQKYPDCEFFEEPSIQGLEGGDFITITLSDDSESVIEFDWNDELQDIWELGANAAAKKYAQEIFKEIDGAATGTVEDSDESK